MNGVTFKIRRNVKQFTTCLQPAEKLSNLTINILAIRYIKDISVSLFSFQVHSGMVTLLTLKNYCVH